MGWETSYETNKWLCKYDGDIWPFRLFSSSNKFFYLLFFLCTISITTTSTTTIAIKWKKIYRSSSYHGESNFSALLTPTTFLISYCNSAINPLLYAFLSRNFRKGMREIILCSFKKGKNKSLQQRIPLHVSKSVFWQTLYKLIGRCQSSSTRRTNEFTV